MKLESIALFKKKFVLFSYVVLLLPIRRCSDNSYSSFELSSNRAHFRCIRGGTNEKPTSQEPNRFKYHRCIPADSMKLLSTTK